MAKIHILPETLANQIAAGEVVQRPASIVKELVENSLDAGASSISITLRAGGKSEITIRDDGQGMLEEDALLAFERHATSKISELDDLASISSFGFRGEALPSIASISHVRLVTAVEDGEGVEIFVLGGVIKSVKPIGCPKGTEIYVKRLFYNTPARRKFLKTTFTEYNHCLNIITKFAIMHPEISWDLEHDRNPVYRLPIADSIEQRIVQIFGDSYLKSMVAFSGSKDAIRVHGLLGNLFLARSDRNQQYFFVNKRPVFNMTMRNALTKVTRNVLPKGKFPVIFVHVECDPEYVDVNVHPAKTEVKFRQEWSVYELMMEVLSDIFSKQVPQTTPRSFHSPDFSSMNEQPVTPVLKDNSGQIPASPRYYAEYQEEQQADRRTKADQPLIPEGLTKHVPENASEWIFNNDFFAQLRFIGQVFQSFLIFETANEMVLLDQHAAHERILYEKVRDRIESHSIPTQHLLVPENLDFSPAEFGYILKNKTLLESMGFVIDEFGKNSLIIRSIPVWLGHHDPRPVFLEIIDEMKQRLSDSEKLSPIINQELAKIIACKSAIKVHRHVTELEATDLITQLASTKIPFTCPHGRPIIVSFSFRDIEKFFHR